MAPGLINFSLQESSRHFKESVIVIIDYQAGNLTSVVRSLKALGVEGTVTQDPAVVAQATRVIFPGVGAAGKAMATLRELGLDQALRHSFQRGTSTPFITIQSASESSATRHGIRINGNNASATAGKRIKAKLLTR